MNIKVDKSLMTAYAQIQERKGQGKWMILNYNEKDGKVSITKSAMKEEKEDEDEVLETFVKAVKENDPCWAFIEYKDTIFFVSYITDNAKPQKKMPMAFNRKNFTEKFDGIKVNRECTEPAQLELSQFKKLLKKVG